MITEKFKPVETIPLKIKIINTQQLSVADLKQSVASLLNSYGSSAGSSLMDMNEGSAGTSAKLGSVVLPIATQSHLKTLVEQVDWLHDHQQELTLRKNNSFSTL